MLSSCLTHADHWEQRNALVLFRMGTWCRYTIAAWGTPLCRCTRPRALVALRTSDPSCVDALVSRLCLSPSRGTRGQPIRASPLVHSGHRSPEGPREVGSRCHHVTFPPSARLMDEDAEYDLARPAWHPTRSDAEHDRHDSRQRSAATTRFVWKGGWAPKHVQPPVSDGLPGAPRIRDPAHARDAGRTFWHGKRTTPYRVSRCARRLQ